ncbi:MAG: SNF2-related protein [Rhodoferax sp.]|uniref:SNF2-related protein n=1 Tax=Rhodoferax sp. TaxID=50421 RepID=UPI00271A1D4D|nr:SNF2-related protein [Rhodoferax sp.]MDO8450342.1 SNF2-related protein [Rhodoferax sp.]
MFKLFKKSGEPSGNHWVRSWSASGVHLSRGESSCGLHIESPLVDGFMTQLADDGHAVETADGYIVDWDSLYSALEEPANGALAGLLSLPHLTQSRPALRSRNSLTDTDFSVAISGWSDDTGGSSQWELVGPLMTSGDKVELMRPAQWVLFKEVVAFAKRRPDQRDNLTHRQAWGRIRKLALAANARLDDFLHRCVVITPERLQIGLRRSEHVSDDRVIEIEPSFEGAPAGWLNAFDSNRDVRDRYDIVTDEGIVQVLIAPKVRTVLEEVKRLPGRRVAGSRAQAFLLNPYATLGDDAVDVIVESQFEQARENAGLGYERFLPVFERDAVGYPLRVGLLIETANTNGPASSETQWLDDSSLGAFVRALQTAIARGYQLVAWQGYDLEIQGDTPRHLAELKEALETRQVPPMLVSYATVHDLSGYSSRVEAIGIEKPYYSPYIAKKKDDEGWFPENVLPVVVYQPHGESEPVAVPTSSEVIDQLRKAVVTAKAKGETTVSVPWLPKPLTIQEADGITTTFSEVFDDVKAGRFDPSKQGAARRQGTTASKSLILRANIQSLDYDEPRREALLAFPKEPELPATMQPEFSLLPHQREGLAWMQHLYKLQAEQHVRGAILGDDMGLGKTFQLLALMAWLIERDPNVEPMLVVAPVSLLENWAEEARKFFRPEALPILTAYGSALQPLRVPRAQIDQRLRDEDGLVKFLRPNWIGAAKVVLTTYETLRDLEFSFAAQRWSLMVCDEAQRIKNPAAMVTRAAKKQNVGFRIACTGTPVENTLADMWCLFDFVQPGLLGALNDFGQRYRKPIEAKTEEETARVEELRARIAPQILRRMKAEVAKDLPNKIIVDECRKLPLSVVQRNLYAKAVESFKRRGDPAHPTPFKNHLGLLHYLRVVCTDPRPYGLNVFKPEPIQQYREKAPKLDWLLKELKVIKAKGEKVIVFCEFREIQRLLQHYIEEAFGIRPDIINGDTSASASHTASRQKRIKAFQSKPGFGVIVLSPVAVGFGVNIQGANHVVHYTRTWNPAKEDQATDRAYRIGQTKDVYVYYPVVCAEDFTTFDIKLDQLLAYKRGLADDMLNGSGDVGPGDFNIGDVVPEAEGKDIDERVSIDVALRMSWQTFECLAGVLWTKRGFACYRTPGSNDNGVDVVALANGSGELVQAKTSGTDGAMLGWEAVKDVVTGEAFYKRRHPNVEFAKVCITNQFFNEHAQKNAKLNSVELIDQIQLTSLLEKHSVMLLEVEKMQFAEWQE